MRKEGELFRNDKENETGDNIMLNKSTLLFAALISASLPIIAQAAEINAPNTQGIHSTACPTTGDSSTRTSTVPAGLKGHVVTKSEDSGSDCMKDKDAKTSAVPAGLKGHVIIKSESSSSDCMKDKDSKTSMLPAGLKGHVVIKSEVRGSECLKDMNTSTSTVPAGLKGHFVINSVDKGSGCMKDNKPEPLQICKTVPVSCSPKTGHI
ncbi:MAG: hypothetical protein WCI90_06165 [Chlorobium sp.]|nr:MAG: hypothetical protein FDX17_06975 [Chlorobium sp.]